MVNFNPFQKVSRSPTNPAARETRDPAAAPAFDVATLFDGPVPLGEAATASSAELNERLRQAYFWIVNNAIISPHYDIEFHSKPPARFKVGDAGSVLTLPTAQSYSSFVVMPLLTFATRSKCLFIGGPGRGKTASALLMGVLAGYEIRDVRRAMQHGHPQMTIADLIGNPLPADLVGAQDMKDIRIAWRNWLGMRVKIIDEYNRIPTRTQSALLTVMGDNYAEILNHIYECPDSAWFLTANDDRGGGTYQVIEALRDRIDVIVQALSFNMRFLGDLLQRMEEDARPEELVPPELIFTEAEITRMTKEIRQLPVPEPVRRRMEFFASQFELMESAGEQFEYKTKDTARLAKTEWHEMAAADTGRDRLRDLGCQTTNGLSVRNLMTLLKFAKALAWFRGLDEVSLEDVRQVLPFVLMDKLSPDPEAPFFALPENGIYRSDRLSWLRRLFDLSCEDYDRLNLDRDDPVSAVSREFDEGLDGLSARDTRSRLVQIERIIADLTKGRKLHGHLYDDLLTLKYLHQRYTNYLAWLEAQ